MKGRVQTVSGVVKATELGFVLPHEHIVCASAGFARSWSSLFVDRAALVEIGVEGLNAAREAGVNAIVDATPFDLGRDAGILRDVAEQSGVKVVAATGHWLVPAPATTARTTEELTDFFRHEILIGMDGTNIRAGIIKVASESEVTDFDGKVLEAAAVVSRETGTPILTHAGSANRIGTLQADLLEDLGVDPSSVMIGHCDDSSDIDYLSGLAARGYFVGMDRLPCGALPEYGSQRVDDRIEMVRRLVEEGHADRVMLSHDDPLWAGLLTAEDQARHLESNPWRLAFIARVAIPKLLAVGVALDVVHQMTVLNPARWLGGMAT